MDLTVEVMLPPRGDVDFARGQNGRYRVLAAVAVYPLKTTAVVGMQRSGYLHVTGVPVVDKGGGERTLAHLNRVLCEPWTRADGSLRERRKWCGVPAALPARVVSTLLESRQATVAWAEFKALFRHQIDIRNLSDEDIQ